MAKKNIYELLCFILTSARGCVDEPAIYGPLRLLDTFSRLIDTLEEEDLEPFWGTQKEQIDNFKTLAMFDEEAFVKAIDQILIDVAKFMAGRI